MTGYSCRSGRYFASEYWKDEGCAPDILTTAKSMGAGIPISAITASAQIMDKVPAGVIGGTFCGNPLACAAALKTMEIMKRDDYAGKARILGEWVKEGYLRMQKQYPVIGDIRGLGAMIGVELVKDPVTREPAAELTSRVIRNALQKGLLFFC